jgi:hypothetical protein
MLPPRSRFRSGQDRATGDILPKNRNLTIFWTFYQASQRLVGEHGEGGLSAGELLVMLLEKLR